MRVRVDDGAHWHTPRTGFIKVNIDGARTDAARLAGFGVILRDSASALCGGVAGPICCQSAPVCLKWKWHLLV